MDKRHNLYITFLFLFSIILPLSVDAAPAESANNTNRASLQSATETYICDSRCPDEASAKNVALNYALSKNDTLKCDSTQKSENAACVSPHTTEVAILNTALKQVWLFRVTRTEHSPYALKIKGIPVPNELKNDYQELIADVSNVTFLSSADIEGFTHPNNQDNHTDILQCPENTALSYLIDDQKIAQLKSTIKQQLSSLLKELSSALSGTLVDHLGLSSFTVSLTVAKGLAAAETPATKKNTTTARYVKSFDHSEKVSPLTDRLVFDIIFTRTGGKQSIVNVVLNTHLSRVAGGIDVANLEGKQIPAPFIDNTCALTKLSKLSHSGTFKEHETGHVIERISLAPTHNTNQQVTVEKNCDIDYFRGQDRLYTFITPGCPSPD